MTDLEKGIHHYRGDTGEKLYVLDDLTRAGWTLEDLPANFKDASAKAFKTRLEKEQYEEYRHEVTSNLRSALEEFMASPGGRLLIHELPGYSDAITQIFSALEDLIPAILAFEHLEDIKENKGQIRLKMPQCFELFMKANNSLLLAYRYLPSLSTAKFTKKGLQLKHNPAIQIEALMPGMKFVSSEEVISKIRTSGAIESSAPITFDDYSKFLNQLFGNNFAALDRAYKFLRKSLVGFDTADTQLFSAMGIVAPEEEEAGENESDKGFGPN